MTATVRAVLLSGLGLLVIAGGCIGWNETAIGRAERRVRRLVRPGMSAAAAQEALREAGASVRDRPPLAKMVGGMFGDVQCIYIGTATLHVVVHLDAEDRVVEVAFSVTTSCL